MPCYSPIQAYWLTGEKTSKGARTIVFKEPRDGEVYLPLQVPCGQCIGCRLQRARNWAIRCLHESKLHERNCFITLTYDPEKLPDHFDGGLHKRDLQLFMKRLRRRFPDDRIRYLSCGEYGEHYSRPHYHICVFGFDFPDKEKFKKTDTGYLFTSKILEEIWGYGYCLIGDVTFNSASYVAGYIIKKQLGKDNEFKYVDLSTGLLREREFILMSRRPGIGRGWIDKYHDEVYPSDSVIVDGYPVRPCRYYDNYLSDIDELKLKKVKKKRVDKAKKFKDHCTKERLATREKLALLKLKTFKKRSYENG